MTVHEACSNCGSSAWHVLDRRERLAAWFRSGPGANDVRCEGCGASHGGSSWYRLGWQGLGPLARLRQLPQLWRYLQHARSWHPTPLFYTYVMAAALVPGVAAAAVTRRRWLAIATPLAAFVTTFAIAARPLVSRRGRDLLREFVDPVGSDRRDVARRAAALREQRGRVPVLLPADWGGPVRLGGIMLSSDADAPVRSVTVAAQPPDEQVLEPRVVLRTVTPDDFDPDIPVMVVANAECRADAGDDRAIGTVVGPASANLQVFDMPEPPAERVAELQTAWRETSLAVDGEPVPARLLVGRRAQAAVIDLDEYVVEITGHGVDLAALALHRPADLESLISAFESGRMGGS